jgi:hypothetical protein
MVTLLTMKIHYRISCKVLNQIMKKVNHMQYNKQILGSK